MYSNFTVHALPAARTAQWIAHLWGGRLEVGPKSRRATFILRRRYTHSARMIRCILAELDIPASIHVYHHPPLDPSDFLIAGGKLPSNLLHRIYHTYPTDPVNLSQAVRHLLLRRRYTEADVLLHLGADPRTSHIDLLEPHEVFFLPDHAKTHLERIAWSPKWLRRRICECGWKGVPILPTPAQCFLLRATADAFNYVGPIENVKYRLYKFIKNSDHHEIELIKAQAEIVEPGISEELYSRHFTRPPSLHCFALPNSGTVAKFPVQLHDRYTDVTEILKLHPTRQAGPSSDHMSAELFEWYEEILTSLAMAVWKDYWRAYRALLLQAVEVTE